jgi:hypothetical protein
MNRLNFTLDSPTVELLNRLAGRYYGGNKSLTVRAALESLATHVGHEGWVIAGYTPVVLDDQTDCHTCGSLYGQGEVLYRPVFRRGQGHQALAHIPTRPWLSCPSCVELTGD